MKHLIRLCVAFLLFPASLAWAGAKIDPPQAPDLTFGLGTYKIEVYRVSTFDVDTHLYSVRVPEIGRLAATSTSLPDALAELGNLIMGLQVGSVSQDDALTPAVRQMLKPHTLSGTVSRMEFKPNGEKGRTYTISLSEFGDRRFVVEDWMLPSGDSEEVDTEHRSAPKVGRYIYLTFINSATKGFSTVLDLSYDMPTPNYN